MESEYCEELLRSDLIGLDRFSSDNTAGDTADASRTWTKDAVDEEVDEERAESFEVVLLKEGRTNDALKEFSLLLFASSGNCLSMGDSLLHSKSRDDNGPSCDMTDEMGGRVSGGSCVGRGDVECDEDDVAFEVSRMGGSMSGSSDEVLILGGMLIRAVAVWVFTRA